jgi:transcriptional regulator with XRE-family HTH domain
MNPVTESTQETRAPQRPGAAGLDPIALGRQLRHLRRAAAMTLGDLAERTGMSSSALSLIENGKREPKLSVLTALAAVFGVPVAALLAPAPPSRRAALEIALERIQRAESFDALGVPPVKIGPRLPTDVLESLVGLHQALADVAAERAATPEQARRANADLRDEMRVRGNYFGDIEQAAADLLDATGHDAGPITRSVVDRMAGHLGMTLVHSSDLPSSTRSVTDMKHRRIFLPQPGAGQHDSRALALQALGSIVLGHRVPQDYAEFLSQRVAINYFAAALLIPERSAVAILREAKAR